MSSRERWVRGRGLSSGWKSGGLPSHFSEAAAAAGGLLRRTAPFLAAIRSRRERGLPDSNPQLFWAAVRDLFFRPPGRASSVGVALFLRSAAPTL